MFSGNFDALNANTDGSFFFHPIFKIKRIRRYWPLLCHLQTTYDKLKQELNRCEAEKRRHIKVFVDRIRQEILKMWDQLLMSDEEREQFGAFTSECYNDDLLLLHELELESLKETFEQNKYVVRLIIQPPESSETNISSKNS